MFRGGTFVPISVRCRLCPSVTWHTVRCDALSCHRTVLRRPGRESPPPSRMENAGLVSASWRSATAGRVMTLGNWWFTCEKSCQNRLPPLLPETVRQLLEKEKTFTNKSDVGSVADLYQRFFDDVSNSVEELSPISGPKVREHLSGKELECARLRWSSLFQAVTIVQNSDPKNTLVVGQAWCVSNVAWE